MPPITLRHWLLLLFLVFSWGSAIILTRVAVHDIPPLWVTAGRLTTGAVALALYRLAFVRRSWTLGWHHAPWILWLALLSSALPFLLIAWGTQSTSSAIAGILMGTIPLIVLGLAHLLLPDEKMTRQKTFGFGLGFIGVIFIINPTGDVINLGESAEIVGQIAIFLAAFCYALNSVSTRRMPAAHVLDKATAVVITASLLLLAACLIFEPFENLGRASREKWLILLYLGLIPTALATLVLFVLLAETSAGFVATSNYLIPIVTALGGIAFLRESLSASVWLGFAIILAGLLLANRKTPGQTHIKQLDNKKGRSHL